jgi:hypothetical protein
MDELLKQAEPYDRAAFQCMIGSVLEDLLARTERDAKVGCLQSGSGENAEASCFARRARISFARYR